MGLAVFLLALCVAGFHVLHYYPSLPETLAVSFGTAGQPNGWMTRDGFVAYYFALLVFVTGVFSGLGALLPKFPHLINIPNKAYWIASERKEATLRDLRRWMNLLAAVLAASIISMHQLLFEINIKGDPVLDERFFTGVGLFIAVVLGLVVRLYQRFRKPPRAP